MLTGITDSMVAGSPRIESALPAFLEFAAGSVLVAHNAGFDISFLKAAARRTEHEWPGFAVLDTVHLARQLVHRDEVPNHRLASLARLFRATTTPDHRALHDARATVDVLHGLSSGSARSACTPSRSCSTTPPGSPRPAAASATSPTTCPTCPGSTCSRTAQGRVLYVGTSRRPSAPACAPTSRPSEHRRRMGEMVRIAESVSPIVCATTLEAEVRELRLIAEHKPRYNRRSRYPERALWVKLTVEPFPRLSIVRVVADDGARYVGPVQLALGRRGRRWPPCTRCCRCASASSGSRPRKPRSACALADMGRCGAPCTGRQSRRRLRRCVADRAVDLLAGDTRDLLDALRARMARPRRRERFEDAQVVRDRLVALVRGTSRSQRLDPLARIPELVAAPPHAARRLGGRLRAARPARRQHHVRRAAPTRCPTSRRCGPAPRSSRPRCRRPGRHARGEREDPALARVPRGAHRRGRRRVDLPGRRRGARGPDARPRRAALAPVGERPSGALTLGAGAARR